MSSLQEKWDTIHSQSSYPGEAAEVLVKNSYLLPAHGRGLDLACGTGGNALMLAGAGLSVEAWDISGVALRKLHVRAMEDHCHIETKCCQITPAVFPKRMYDVIVVSRFLDRGCCNAIMEALNSDGLLFYQTYIRDKLNESGPRNPDYLLERNELLRLFTPLAPVFYQEYTNIGDLRYGNRNEVLYVGQRT